MDLKNKKVIVLGLGRTGYSTSLFLSKKEADVLVIDNSINGSLLELSKELEEHKIRIMLNTPYETVDFKDCDLIIISPGISHKIKTIEDAGKKIPVISEIELAYHFIKAPIIAVTGTNGKTTTVSLINDILVNAGKEVFLGGNIGRPLINACLNEEHYDFVVAELSSFQLDTIKNFKPKIAAILNITEDHFDRYESNLEYIQSKLRIFENQNENGFAVLNYKDENIRKFLSNIKSKKCSFNCDFKENSKNHSYISKDTAFFENGQISLKETNLSGIFNLENIAAAVLISNILNIDFNIIKDTIKEFEGLTARLEYVCSINDVKFYNDSKATNVNSVLKALESFNVPVNLIMCGRHKGDNFKA